SPRMLRGFGFFTYDQGGDGGSARLQAEGRDVGLRPDHPVLSAPFVVRLTLHRTPRAPLALPVLLGAPFPSGAAKLDRASAEAGHLIVCDAPAIQIAPLGSD